MPLSSSSLTLPSGFPDTQFEALSDRIVATLPNPSRDLEEIGAGHNAVRFRLRACADYSEEFLQSLTRRGTAPTLEDRYQQERELFGFFFSGIATLDSFSYFLYFAAAQINAAVFRTQTRRDLSSITFKKTNDLFIANFGTEPITAVLTAVSTDPNFRKWADYRNILTHRAAPGRLIFGSFGGVPQRTTEWKIDPTQTLQIDANLTAQRLTWLIGTMANLVGATAAFVNQYF